MRGFAQRVAASLVVVLGLFLVPAPGSIYAPAPGLSPGQPDATEGRAPDRAARAGGLIAQQLDPPPPPADSGTLVQVVPGADYAAGGLRRFLIGDNRRDLWVRELTVPVLDLDRFAGGLTPLKEGGNQSRTLHLRGADGRTYIFRSVDKYMGGVFPEDLRGTVVQAIAQDHISAFHPGAAFVVPRLHEALAQLPVPPVYRVMPDHPRLGEFRETFAGMLGTVVERPDEGPHGEALFAGSHRVVGTDRLFERLGRHPRHRVAAEEFLAARLVDFLVGDSDRGPDQWRWARTPAPRGFRWRPVIRDRDWALIDADGVLPFVVARFYPKLISFSDELPPVSRLTWADVGMGRRLLSELDRATFDSVAAAVVARLSDPVINEAVIDLPPEQKAGHAGELVARLRARRAELPAAARRWYDRLASDVDIHGTELADRAEAVRHADGTVTVTLYGSAAGLVPVVEPDAGDDDDAAAHAADPYYAPATTGSAARAGWAPYYRRTFRPSETDEVRLYLEGGADVAVVRGEGSGAITVRVIGGAGEDALHDRARPSRATALYDDDPGTRFVRGRRTHIDRRSFEPPTGSERFLADKTGTDRYRDWGSEISWFSPTAEYREGAGLILGGGSSWTDYRFRAVPYGIRASANALVSTLTGGVGVDARAEARFPGSSAYLAARVRATPFEATRFYGYGNDSPLIDVDRALIFQERLLAQAVVGSRGAGWEFQFGPLLRYRNPDVPAGNPAEGLLGSRIVTSIGAAARLGLERMRGTDDVPRGLRLDLNGSLYPDPEGIPALYAMTAAEIRGYLPIPAPAGTVVAARVGTRRSWGDFPVHDAATVGGSATLRGYRWERFSGDVAAYGGMELRVPVTRSNLWLARGQLGVLGLVDTGRVWFEGESPGGWHAGYGAGLFFRTLGSAVHLTWAYGEEHRLYVGLGLPY
jgi:hypothetical protein